MNVRYVRKIEFSCEKFMEHHSKRLIIENKYAVWNCTTLYKKIIILYF